MQQADPEVAADLDAIVQRFIDATGWKPAIVKHVADLQQGPRHDDAAGHQQGHRAACRARHAASLGAHTLAIGDAENDHELLRLAEVGAAAAITVSSS